MDFLIQTTLKVVASTGGQWFITIAIPTVVMWVTYIYDHSVVVITLLIALIAVLSFLNSIGKIVWHGIINRNIAKLIPEKPRILNEGQPKRILVLGDSTAYGTGALRVEDTLAGKFAHDFPNVEVDNYAVNGAITKDVIHQLEQVKGSYYNLTIISTGGNDTWHVTSPASIEQYLRDIINQSMLLSGKNIILIIYNNETSAPVFPFLVRGRILKRTRLFYEIFTRVGKEYGIETVPIFLPAEKCPSNFFAHDGLHPSATGYNIMYTRLWTKLYEKRYELKLRDY